MRFFRQIVGSVSGGSRARDPRFASRRRSQFGCETLEGRALLSNIPGVSLQYGNLAITATKAGGNVAEVSVDPATHNIKVSLNGLCEEFSASKVGTVTYKGGMSGGDTFTNNTGLWEFAVGHGGHNTFTGGTSSYNVVYLLGNDNTYNAQAGSSSNVVEMGTGDTINAPTNATVELDPPAPGINLN